MSLVQQIEKDYISAYKAKDQVKLGVLRHLKTAAKNLQVELMRELTDEDMLGIVMKQTKQRQDSIEQYTSAGREDLAKTEAAELEVLKEYMPKPLSDEELDAIVTETIASVGAESVRDMGKVMNAISASYKGRFDGKQLSTLVRSRLA